jgi:putative pyridoxal-dependent aspartate 1-decarboxylase
MRDPLTELFSIFLPPVRVDANFRERMVASVQHFQRENNVTTPADPLLLKSKFAETQAPDQSMSLESYIEYLENQIIPYSVNMSSPRCIGHMSSALPNFVLALSDLIALLNQNLVKREASKTFTLLERQTLGMIHRVIYGFSKDFYVEHVQNETSTLGIMSSGGTLANITALWIARNSCFARSGGFAGVEEEGMLGALEHYHYDGAVVIGSDLMHYSIEKAASVLGLGASSVIKLPVDDRNRIDLRALEHSIAECDAHRQRIIAVIGIAGSTDCGSVDPLSEIAEITRKAGIHFHVDAAWGAPLLFSRRHRCKLAGIELADSVTVDGHKQMYLPIGTSMLLLRDPQAANVIEKHSRYMLQERSGDLGTYSLQGSRPATAVFVHAAVHIIGRDGYELIVDENIRKAAEMANAIQNRSDFELLVPPETNVLLYRYVPAAWRAALLRGELTCSANTEINCLNEILQKTQYEAGCSFVSRTAVSKTCEDKRISIVALRAVIGNPFTSKEDIETVLEDQARIAQQLETN